MKLAASAPVWLGVALVLTTPAATATASDLVAGNSAFAAELYAKIAPPSGNLFFSPYSVSLALALAYAGSRGETAAEMARVLHLPESPTAATQGFAELARHFAAIPAADATLTVGNSLWYQTGFRLTDSYLRVAHESYQARIQAEDFIGHARLAGDDINHWVDAATQGKISRLIDAGALGPATRVVLANAIYFKGRWALPFPSQRTQAAPFFSRWGESTFVPTMHQNTLTRLAALPGFRVLELPYRGNNLSLILLLPDTIDGLAKIEQQLSGDNLTSWLDRLALANRIEVALSLPRFNAETGLDLSAALRQLGLSRAFDPQQADFSGMAAARGFSLSQVVHKAVVEMNEEGTVAAAATGVTMHSFAIEARPAAVFRVDHPFLFLIRENSTGTVLFLGRITDPRP